MYYLASNPQVILSADTIQIRGSYTSVAVGGGSATALTLPDPSTADNGALLVVVARTAQAHTVTNTTGFNGGSTASDVATFGGAIGDSIMCIADDGQWNVLNLRNVTLG
jgi:hypothetical protein